MKKKLLSILILISFGANAQFWSEKATGFTTPQRGLFSISIVDTNVVWALADDSTKDPVDLKIKEFTLSTDGGNTWTPGSIDLGIATNELGISSITAVSSTTAWVSVHPDTFGTSQRGGIWKTINGGITWTKQPSALFNSAASYANFVHFWDATNGITQGDPESGEFEVYTTNNGGTNWTRVDGATIPNPNINGEYGYANLYTVYGNTIWFGTDMGRIYRSSDKGLTWNAYNSVYSTDFNLDSFTFSDTNKGLMMTYNPVNLYSTSDGGATWNPVSRTGNVYNTDISYIPGTSTVISCSLANPLGSSYSLDDGLTWTTIDGIKHGTMKFLNTTFGFSGGFNTNATTGGIFKYSGIPLKNASFELKNHITAYPNPTNGILHIDSEIASIKNTAVFDLLGKQVFDKKFSSLNKADLDLKSLQAGTYLLKVSSENGKTETIKILKN
ncbi:T9SS type A sorting domain-containing protein [Flavobacterium cellulosilyticum]|uniref:T9SS type A sorting domain-containing protein n=1 Tax=Flavobacterium cellulosilyticum TaxID=2541731 RepID=A0A4V2YZB6_9FLAO|nr:T9SS type A sorting domain-containing protein [Flavobacterium cellulosilyticum]TDD96497.1 T9SS type A sorting domain-containing protein [Flavobacterium cellulosilyticum]